MFHDGITELISEYLDFPVGKGKLCDWPHTGHAGGVLCGDVVRISVDVCGGIVRQVGWDAQACAATQAACSALTDFAQGMGVLDAAKISSKTISDELGGLAASHLHAADLAADAFAVALGRAVFADPQPPADLDDTFTLVAMSGGVDSSTVCAILADQGDRVAGVTVELWRDTVNDAESSCCSISAVRQARAQAHQAGLAHFTLDLRDRFAAEVVGPYLDAHRNGDTPNPCVACNGDVRIDDMVRLASQVGARWLATGHYARIDDDGNGPLLAPAVDVRKDQTFMLAKVNPRTLARLKFPLGNRTKPQVREIAAAYGLVAADKPDSQDLCFLAGTSRRDFLSRHGQIVDRPGPIVTRDGQVVGSHQGAHHHTVGQRRGLQLDRTPVDGPMYVLDVLGQSNTVIVGSREQLAVEHVTLAGVRLYRPAARVAFLRPRYKSQPLACRADDRNVGEGVHRRLTITLADAHDGGIAPGQAASLLDDQQRVIGVGIIVRR